MCCKVMKRIMASLGIQTFAFGPVKTPVRSIARSGQGPLPEDVCKNQSESMLQAGAWFQTAGHESVHSVPWKQLQRFDSNYVKGNLNSEKSDPILKLLSFLFFSAFFCTTENQQRIPRVESTHLLRLEDVPRHAVGLREKKHEQLMKSKDVCSINWC